jgi:hypothetical protein
MPVEEDQQITHRCVGTDGDGEGTHNVADNFQMTRLLNLLHAGRILVGYSNQSILGLSGGVQMSLSFDIAAFPEDPSSSFGWVWVSLFFAHGREKI